jgi:hypothetical protein
MWALGAWMSLPLLRLEAKIVHDPQKAATQKASNTISQAQQKAQVAAKVGTTAAKMTQKQIHHLTEKMQKWAHHVQDVTMELNRLIEGGAQLLNMGRNLTTMGGVLRLFVNQFDSTSAALKMFRDLGDLYLTVRGLAGQFYQGIDLFFQGRSLVNELRNLKNLKNPSVWLSLWEKFALDTGAVQVYQDRRLLRALLYQHDRLTKEMVRYRNNSARLVELQAKLQRVEAEIEAAQKRVTRQPNDPGRVTHPQIPTQSPNLPSQAPVAGPHVMPPRQPTNAGEQHLLKLRSSLEDQIARQEQILIESLTITHQEMEEFLQGVLEPAIKEAEFQSLIESAWLENQVSGATLFGILIGDTAFGDTYVPLPPN